MSKIIWQDRKHWMWFPFSFTKYQLSRTRFFEEKGLFNTIFSETQLYRIVDVQLKRTFVQKIFGTGTVTLATRDQGSPFIEVKNIKNSKAVKEMIVELVEEARRKNMVRDINIGDGFDSDFEDLDGNGIPDRFE